MTTAPAPQLSISLTLSTSAVSEQLLTIIGLLRSRPRYFTSVVAIAVVFCYPILFSFFITVLKSVLSRIILPTSATGMRSWDMVSRSRMVTQLSSLV